MNRYRDELGIEATPAELEATARATIRQLEEDTATVTHRAGRPSAAGTLALDVAVTQPDRPQVPDRLSVAPRVAARHGARPPGARRVRVGPGDREPA